MTLLVGDATATYSIADSSGVGGANYLQFTALASGMLDTILVRSSSVANTCTSLALGIYADNAGVPGVVLGQATVAGTPPTSTWVSATGLGVTIVSGTVYWLAFWNPGGTFNFNDAVASGGTTQKWTSGASGLLDNPTISGTAQGGPNGIQGTGTLSTGYAKVVLNTAGLVSYWRLGEASGTNAADSQGSNAGTYVGTPVLNQTGALFGDTNPAVKINGASAVSTFYNPFVHAGSQTFELWATTPSTPISKPLFSGDGATTVSLWFDTAVNIGWYPANVQEATWASAWPGNSVWVHVALTYNDSTGVAELYINGVSKGTSTVATDRYATTGNIKLGSTATAAWPGTIDEFAVYNVIVPAATIKNHWAEGVTMRSDQIARRAPAHVAGVSQGRF